MFMGQNSTYDPTVVLWKFWGVLGVAVMGSPTAI